MISLAKDLLHSIAERALSPVASRHLRNIFLLGHDRSGSTWIASTLGLAADAIYLHEPMNESSSRAGNWELYNTYLGRGEDSPDHAKVYDPAAKGFGVKRLSLREWKIRLFSHPSIIIKETGGMLLGEWFEERYGGRILALIRHPAPVILSNIAMDADNAGRWFEALKRQRPVADVPGFAAKLTSIDVRDPVQTFAAVYCVRYEILLDQLECHPQWMLLRYEDFAADPVAEFRRLFASVGFDFTPEVEREVGRRCSSEGPESFFGTERNSRAVLTRWKSKVDRDMERRIRRVLEEFSFPLYNSASDWDSARG
jgi:hypothetical protein